MGLTKEKVKTETAYGYTNKFTKKKLKFTPTSEEIVATFKPEVDDHAAMEAMAATSMAMSSGLDQERAFVVFQVGPRSDTSEATMALENQGNIINTLPVMEDEEGLKRYFMPDEFDVQFKADVSQEKAEELIAAAGCIIVQKHRTPGYYTVTVPKDKGLFETLQKFSNMRRVSFAEPSEFGLDDTAYIPDDDNFKNLWGLHNIGQIVNGAPGSTDADIDVPHAWDIERGDRNVIVTVIDTGCDMDHPDLKNNLLPRGSEDWDFADPNDESPDDSGSHGTHVAGTAAAVDNKEGIIGVAPQCRIMPLRVKLISGFNANRADAINYVAAQAVTHPQRRYVINCSWVMNGNHAGVHNAIINAFKQNVLVCFAAGNDNRNIDSIPRYPAVYPEVISVAATDQHDIRADFSNYGKKVDVAAPGVNIYSTVPDDRHGFKNGTSMASPHVAGLAALIWSRNRDLSNKKVRNIIESTCDNIDDNNPEFVNLLGKGRINAYRALRMTPRPAVKYKLRAKYNFPQKNAGSSSALAFAVRMRIGGWFRPVLMFLTQKPYSERIYYLHPYTGHVLGSIDPVGNDTIGSMEWNGRLILAANVTTGSGSINFIHPNTGAQLGTLGVPAGRGEGLAYDGEYYYYSTINRIHVIRRADGHVVRSFPPPGGPCQALAYGRGYLFSGNSSTGRITIFNRHTLRIRGVVPAPGGGSNQVEGLAFRRSTNDLFVANQSENRIYVLRLEL